MLLAKIKDSCSDDEYEGMLSKLEVDEDQIISVREGARILVPHRKVDPNADMDNPIIRGYYYLPVCEIPVHMVKEVEAKLRSSGIKWTPLVEKFYRVITCKKLEEGPGSSEEQAAEEGQGKSIEELIDDFDDLHREVFRDLNPEETVTEEKFAQVIELIKKARAILRCYKATWTANRRCRRSSANVSSALKVLEWLDRAKIEQVLEDSEFNQVRTQVALYAIDGQQYSLKREWDRKLQPIIDGYGGTDDETKIWIADVLVGKRRPHDR